MSGAAALAAARRRRAGGGVPIQNTNPPPTPNNTPKPSNSSKNPLSVLVEHDKQIGLLSKEISEMKENTPKETSEKDLEFYKEKYETLLSQMTELRTTIVKLQSFCMQNTTEIQSLKNSLSENNNEKTSVPIQEDNLEKND